MANNYTKASFVVPCTDEQANYLLELFATEVEEGVCVDCQAERRNNGVWVYSEDSLDVERVADAIVTMLRKFDLDTVVWFEWANTCSKPRIGEFSGGGVRVSKDGTDWFTPHNLYREEYPND